MEKIYDTIIIGGGPAGLTAALYAGRAKMSVLIIEKADFGGQISTTDQVDNYPGAEEGATGYSITNRMMKQAESFGAVFIKDEVISVDLLSKTKVIKGLMANYEAKTVIIAVGANPKPGAFENENTFRGRGVSYCATCDADFFTDLTVAVIGGGDSAITEGIYLTRFAEKVIIIHRRDTLRAAKSIQEKAFTNPKISFMWDSVVTMAKGEKILESIVVKNLKTGIITEKSVDGCFVFVGYTPNTEIFEGILNLSNGKYIITDEKMRTNISGIFAVGDVKEGSLKQAVTAAADGAVAATEAEKYIEENNF